MSVRIGGADYTICPKCDRRYVMDFYMTGRLRFVQDGRPHPGPCAYCGGGIPETERMEAATRSPEVRRA